MIGVYQFVGTSVVLNQIVKEVLRYVHLIIWNRVGAIGGHGEKGPIVRIGYCEYITGYGQLTEGRLTLLVQNRTGRIVSERWVVPVHSKRITSSIMIRCSTT